MTSESASRTYPVELTGAQIFGLADLVRRLGTHTMAQDGDAHLRDDLADALTAFVGLLPEPSDDDIDPYLAAVKAGELPDWGQDREPLTETAGEWDAKISARCEAGVTPLHHLDENLVHDGVHWTAEGPRGALWIIRWSSATGNMRAWKPPRGRAGFQAAAADLPAARREAARIAALIADGKTRED
jgi:hypothetical protein